MFILDAEAPNQLSLYLLAKNWLAADEKLISATKAGDGNMNYVLRISTNFRTFIIKQSRAYVEKYPQIAAPATRVITEAAFYQKIAALTTWRLLSRKLVENSQRNPNYRPRILQLWTSRV